MKSLKNNVKSSIKSFICGTLIGILSIGPASSANAQSTATSSTRNYTVNGYSYSAYSMVVTGSNSQGKYATASTVTSYNGSGLPTGYMGSCPMLCHGTSGIVIKYGQWKYNSSGTLSMYNPVNVSGYLDPPIVYAHGEVQFWNGNGYDEYYTHRSPNSSNYT